MSNFRVGQKVVCVDDAKQRSIGKDKDVFSGYVYTIQWVGLSPISGRLCVRLVGVNRFCPSKGIDVPLRVERFRPVAESKTDISIFKAMLEDKQTRVSV